MESKDLQQFTDVVVDFIEPLVRASENIDTARAFMIELGYEPPNDVTAFGEMSKIIGDVLDIVSSVEELIKSNSTDDGKQLEVLIQMIVKGGVSIKHIADFGSKIQENFNGTNLLAQTDILTQLPIRLTDVLFITYLERRLPKIMAIFSFMGILENEFVEEVPPFVPEFQKRIIHWDKITELFTDPVKAIKELFVESDSIRFNKLIYLMEDIGVSLGVFAEVSVPKYERLIAFNGAGIINHPAIEEIRFLKFPLLSDPLAALALEFYPILDPTVEKYTAVAAGLTFGSELSIPIGDKFLLKIKFSSSLLDSLGLKIDKAGKFTFTNSVFSSPQALAEAIQFSFRADLQSVDNPLTGKFLEIGAPGGSKFELGDVAVSFGIDKKGADATVFVEADFKEGLIVISMGGADSFIGKILSGAAIKSNFEIGVGFSNKGGVYFKGGSLEIAIPIHVTLGPIEITGLTLVLKVAGKDIKTQISTSFKGELGPLAFVVENIGVEAIFKIDSGGSAQAGSVKPSFGFKPPNGIGLSIDAGAVVGGGYLFFDFEKEEYAGVLELSIANFISAKAIGLITTKMPDGSKGFSMLIIITVEFNPAFQLGYGFTLVGVGGLLGLNRTMLLDPLRNAVRNGAVNSIMFPQNVVANAPRIISDLKAIFPPYVGKFLIGPMAKIGWGASLITLSLGVVIEIPGNIAIIGVLKVALPTDKQAIVKLQVLFVGTLDFDKKMLTFDASLFESTILVMTIEGDMAVRLKWGENPDFLMSVGGFHPSYTPPPLALPTLRRMAITILNTDYAKIRLECYQAITSNTVQFGVKAELKFDLSVCSIEGFFAFDVLFQFNPFYLIAELSAGFKLRAAGIDVLTVRVRLSIEGPTPWHAKGTGSVSLLFFEISADFDKTWGEEKNTSVPEIAILPKFMEELNKREQWSTILSSNKNLHVTLRAFKEIPNPPLVLHPAGSLVIQQKILPLTMKIDKVGSQPLSDIQKISITRADSGGVSLTLTEVNEDFARAQYQYLSDAEKLSKPSFERLPGGVQVAMGGATVKNGKMVRRLIEYEVTIVDKESQKPFKKGILFGQSGKLFNHFLKGNSVSKSSLSKKHADHLQPFEEKMMFEEEGYSVVFQSNNKAYTTSAKFSSEMKAQTYMQEELAKNPSLKKQIHIIPNYELQES